VSERFNDSFPSKRKKNAGTKERVNTEVAHSSQPDVNVYCVGCSEGTVTVTKKILVAEMQNHPHCDGHTPPTPVSLYFSLPYVCLGCYEQAFLCLQPAAGLLPLHRGGFSWGTWSSGVAAAGFRSTGSVAVRCGLSCFWALWDLPGPGFESTAPAWQAGFLNHWLTRKPFALSSIHHYSWSPERKKPHHLL